MILKELAALRRGRDGDDGEDFDSAGLASNQVSRAFRNMASMKDERLRQSGRVCREFRENCKEKLGVHTGEPWRYTQVWEQVLC